MSTVRINGGFCSAMGVLVKPAVPVISQSLVWVVLGMVQLIITCPGLYNVMKQELLVCGEFVFRDFLWLLQRGGVSTNRH